MSSCWEGAEFLALQVRLSTAALVVPTPQHWQHLKACISLFRCGGGLL